jgi:hypothetical protein
LYELRLADRKAGRAIRALPTRARTGERAQKRPRGFGQDKESSRGARRAR